MRIGRRLRARGSGGVEVLLLVVLPGGHWPSYADREETSGARMDANGQGKQGFRRGGPDGGPPAIDLSRVYDKLPPHAPEAEMALLGSIILDPYTLADVLPLVSVPEDFYRQSNATVFRVLKEVYEREPQADLNVVADRLR